MVEHAHIEELLQPVDQVVLADLHAGEETVRRPNDQSRVLGGDKGGHDELLAFVGRIFPGILDRRLVTVVTVGDQQSLGAELGHHAPYDGWVRYA
jgi:hypothetical protein